MSDARSVTSRDGTTIAFERTGEGPPVVLVAAALSDRSDARKLAELLAPRFTVINYDRRGRGASGDTPPYAVERECEDIEALVKEVGGSACLFGSSSGAVLALEAAARGAGVERLALFEPPFVVSDRLAPQTEDLADRVGEALGSGRRGEAVALFMNRAVGVPTAGVRMMRLMRRTWRNLEAMAHTIPYDLAIMDGYRGGGPLPAERWASVGVPTLVLDGAKSPEHLRAAASALADALPNAQHRTLKGVSHASVVMTPRKLAPTLQRFFVA
ncbi:MAG TPA: alpha/beta hydrolase [Actinomycetota bacterium]|nr:alpha/beta hydrolase [Actinomycetota bacterium]